MGRIVRIPKIESLDFDPEDPKVKPGQTSAQLTGENLETIEKAGWGRTKPNSWKDCRSPIPGEGQKQSLQVRFLPAPEPENSALCVAAGRKQGPRHQCRRSPPREPSRPADTIRSEHA